MKVNGIETMLKESITLEQYLLQEGYTITRVAVELNGEIVPKTAYQDTNLSDYDELEVVHFVGGG